MVNLWPSDHGPLIAGAWGFQLGFGVYTHIVAWAFYPVLIFAVVAPAPWAYLPMVAFGVARGVEPLLAFAVSRRCPLDFLDRVSTIRSVVRTTSLAVTLLLAIAVGTAVIFPGGAI